MKVKLYSLLIMFFGIWSVQMNAQCVADWIFDDTDLTIQFTDSSTTQVNDPIVSWFWDFDDGNTSTEQNPSHTYTIADKYNVELEITTQSGCTDKLTIQIEICEFTISVGQGVCDANGNIPLTITVNDLYDNAKEIDITVDGNLVPGGPFPIDQQNPVIVNYDVPGDGLSHTVNVQSTDIPTCNEDVEFTVDDCGSNCFLSALAVNFAGGTTHTVEVGTGGNNVFTPSQTTIEIGDDVDFVWVDDGHSSTSDATSGPDSWNSGVIGIGSNYVVTIQNPGVHGYYCIPHGGPGGSGMSGTIIANCPAGNQFLLDITFNTTVANSAGFDLIVDGITDPNGPYNYNGTGTQLVQTTISGDGMTHSIEIKDVFDPTCFINTNWDAPDCGAAPPCSLSITAMENGGCDPNDNVPVDVTVTAINQGNLGFNVLVDGVLAPGSPFTYNASGTTVVTVNVMGDGNAHTILVEDVDDNTCNTTVSITTTNCIIPCSITNLTASTGNSNIHTVFVEDFQFNPNQITITSGDIVEWQWIGSVAHTSTSDASSGPDSWDSGLLNTGATYQSPVLSAGIHPYYCIPHGAPGGVGMSGTITVTAPCNNNEVQVTLTFDHTGGSFNGFDVLVDGVISGSFNYDPSGTTTVIINVVGDGQSHSIEVKDKDDPNCLATTNVTTPNCSAPTCQLTVTAQENGGCNANDEVPVDVTVNDVGGGASGFDIYVDGLFVSSHNYSGTGTTVVTINVIGDGNAHTIEAKDIDDPTCTGSTSITTTNCAIPCSITNLTASTGNSQTHVVLVEDFKFTPSQVTITAGDIVEWQWIGSVAHTSTSDATSGPDSWDSGLLNAGATYQSPVLSAGIHPYYCIPHGAPGGVGMSGTITVIAPCNNGEVGVTLTFDHQGGSAGGFDVLIDGVFDSNHAYDPSGTTTITVFVVGDGNSHSIEIVDFDDPNCLATTNVTTPNCNAPTCQLTVSAQENGGCNANDEVPVDVTVNDVGGGASGFDIYVDGLFVSSHSYSGTGTTVVTINVTGDGNVHTIEAKDIDDPTCSGSTSITTTNCAIPCSITNLTASTGNSQTHVVLVEDFKFTPSQVTITAGDIVEWQWIGSVAHTSTSDATSGPDSWDSGLLNAGATYQSPVLSAGIHPYYCIPHGAPGGVGMSGTITVIAPCNNGEVGVTLTFDHAGGSAGGFDVLIDGVFDSNHAYDPSGTTTITVFVVGDGNSHSIEIVDFDDPNCLASTNITTPNCNAPTCQLTVMAQENGGCNANDEVPVDVTVNDVGGGASGFDIYVDGVFVSSHNYSGTGSTVVTINVIGDGSPHTVEAKDTDDPNCSDSATITTTNCIIPCSLSNLTASTGNSITEVVEVKDFEFLPKHITIREADIVDFQWTGVVEHTSTSDSTSGTNTWNSGLLGQGSSFQVSGLSLGVHPYYCIPHGAPGGVGMSGTITVVPDCDANDQVAVNLTFDHQGGSFNGFEIFVDNVSIDTFNYDPSGTTSVTINVDGDGQNHTIEIKDLDDPNCAVSTSIVTPDCTFTPPCELTLSASQTGSCDSLNNVNIALTVNSLNAGQNGFDVFWDSVFVSNFAYDPTGTTVVNISVLGDGNAHLIEVKDTDDPTCSANQNMTVQNCLAQCVLSNLNAASGSSSAHIVEVKDFEFVPKDLTIKEGDTVEWNWTGVIAHTSTSDATSGPDSWDSGLLNTGATFQKSDLSLGNHPYYCIPHGAPGGIGMSGTINVVPDCNNNQVLVTLTFDETDGGLGGFNVFIDSIPDSGNPYPYDPSGMNEITVWIDGDGQSHTIEIQDADDPICSISTNFVTTDCSFTPPCELSLTASQTASCDSVQMVTVELNIEHSNTGQNGFNLLIDGIADSGNPYNYDTSGTTILTLMLDGDGLNHDFEIQDIDSTNCVATTSLTVDNCTLPCSMSNLNLNIQPGNATTHIVEVRDFEFVPKHINVSVGDLIRWEWTGVISHTSTSDSTSGNDVWNSDLLGQGSVFEYTIQSEGFHPYYCIPHGAPGGVGMSGTITAGPALPPCDSTGQIGLNITFEITNGSPNGYEIYVDSALIGNYNYTSGTNSITINLEGDGQNHLIEIRDLDDPNCVISDNIFLPDCTPPMPCEMAVSAEQISDCDSNNEIGVQIKLTSFNSGTSGFNLQVDGNLHAGSPFNYSGSDTTILNINIPGTGDVSTIEVTDLDSINCSASTQINTPFCFQFCEIENLTVSPNTPKKHFIEVKEFEFVPANLDIMVGDTVEFFWTGVIAHTSTSDAISGPNSWDSGLLSAGATFQVIITESGAHPYYCIPHGGPNGIGQSGVINAFEPCENGNEFVEVSFDIQLGSAQGYNVFLDGNQIAGPVPYDDPNGHNSTTINVLGDGMTHLLTVQDLETNFCAATIQFEAPDCNATCQISNLNIEFPQNVTHHVEVKDFEFVPNTLFINLGDTVRFSWTGLIPHTVTSDATTGEDVFDSGLFGQGSEYEVIFQNEGIHPYYCIPHGAPGGVGMSGVITVENSGCQNGMISADLTFQNEATGDNGFNVFTNGILHPDSPFDYAADGNNLIQIDLIGDGELHEIIVSDADDSNCADTLNIITPNCNTNCSLSASYEQIGDCDSNDEILYEINILNENSGKSFSVELDGSHLLTHDYDSSGISIVTVQIPGDGLVHTVEILDSDSLNCSAILEIETIDCDPPCVMNLEANQAGGCDSNNEVSYNFIIENENGSEDGFNFFLNGDLVTGSPFSYDSLGTIINLNLPGDGSIYEIIASDSDDSVCADTVLVTTPICGALCELSDLKIQIEAPQTHEIEVRDFEFVPKEITVNVGDKIRYVWTGIIPHTATADDNSWNSGLFGQGAEFEITADSVGEIPYYCIPHGAPGGIGMSGLITVVDDCDDDLLNVAITFNEENGGFNGYNIYLDGDLTPDSPMAYDSTGLNYFELELAGDGQQVQIVIEDADDVSCQLDSTFIMPDCADPCFGFEAAYEIQIDHQTLEVQLTNLTPNSTDWLWTFGDSTTASTEHPIHTYDSLGWYEICLIGQNAIGCESIYCEEFFVGEYLCEADFSVEMEGLTVHITDESETTDDITQWMWEFGNNHFLVGVQNPSFTYDSLGVYELCLRLQAGTNCKDTTCLTLDLTDPCLPFLPSFAYAVDNDNLSVNFIDQTAGNPNQWLWGFGDGNTSNEQNPEHFFDEPGEYMVCLLVQDTVLGCNQNHCEAIKVGTVGTKNIDIRNHEVVIYPNPSPRENFVWTIEGILEKDYQKILDLKLYDMNGKTILNTKVQGAESVVFSSPTRLSGGVYFVELRSENGIYRGKIIAQ